MARTRRGRSAASVAAVTAPMEWPRRSARRTPSASSSPATSAASRCTVKLSPIGARPAVPPGIRHQDVVPRLEVEGGSRRGTAHRPSARAAGPAAGGPRRCAGRGGRYRRPARGSPSHPDGAIKTWPETWPGQGARSRRPGEGHASREEEPPGRRDRSDHSSSVPGPRVTTIRRSLSRGAGVAAPARHVLPRRRALLISSVRVRPAGSARRTRGHP